MCDWPVYGIHGRIDTARMCGNGTNYQVGPLAICSQHFDILIAGVMDVARDSEDEAERMRVALRGAEVGRRAAEREEREAELAMNGRVPCVYFAERDGFVKIGTTINLGGRIKTLAAGGSMLPGMTVGPVTLLATIPGGLKEEQKLHRRYWHLRVDPKREWFRFEGALRRYIEGLSPPPDPAHPAPAAAARASRAGRSLS